ncbi:MAG: hypothetical protein ACR2MZ_00930 [Candidatus Dormibacter sp.]|uniref:hypothetical protein n=1 Tax=Candidatus Dormibacter sp. TaxID=2973982 RepID=UPI000DAF950E|nr:MAG: hypothetical protein DLM66_04330 [Candidatus Dormibacteraeota bacterium]
MRRLINGWVVAVASLGLVLASGCGLLPGGLPGGGGSSASCVVDFKYFNVEASGDKAAVDAFCKSSTEAKIDKPQGDKVCTHDISQGGRKFTVSVYVRPDADQISHDAANRLCQTYAAMH